MKKLILFAVIAAALIFATGKATASAFNISAKAVFNYTNYIQGTNYIAKTATLSINNAFIYNLISNAVANATNGLATNLPAKGFLVYFPFGNDGKYNGYFYVADTKGPVYPLSGLDTNGQHYSFIELNANDEWFGSLGDSGTNEPQHSFAVLNADDPSFATHGYADHCCCDSGSNGIYRAISSIYMENLSEKTGFGSYSALDSARLYIHSDPYPDPSNDLSSLTLDGTFEPKLTLKYFYPYIPSTATFIGNGHIDLTEGNETEGYTRWHGIMPTVTVKFDF